MLDVKRILVLAPHTDDGELGCGGSLAHIVQETYCDCQNTDILYLAFSYLPEFQDGILAQECENAAEVLHAKTELLTFPVRHFAEFRQDILDKLIVVNRSFSPDLVFAPSKFDVHQDHQTVTAEALRAFKHTTILGYELPWNNYEFKANFFIKLTPAEMDWKLSAIREYKSQAHRTYMNADYILSLARTRGIQVNAEYAEAFHAMRIVQ